MTDYLEGILPGAEQARFEAHMADRDDCPAYLEQMRLTIRALGALPEERVPAVGRDDLLRRFRDWKRP